MLTITQSWLDEFPTWYTAGWRVGDTLDLAQFCTNNPEVATKLANHPPNGPHH